MNSPNPKRRGPLTWLAARTWRFWGVVVLLPLVLYLGSFGPACWLLRNSDLIPNGLFDAIETVYAPVFFVQYAKGTPYWLKRDIHAYRTLWENVRVP